MVQHHPSDDILVEFAAGSIRSHLALCVLVHMKYCSRCRTQVHNFSALGGSLISELPPEPLTEDLFNKVLERIDLTRQECTTAPATEQLLEKWLPHGLSNLTWRKQWFKLYEYVLVVPKRGHWRLTLQKISAGGTAPEHGHCGREATVVLQGGFSDEMGAYDEGDFVIRDDSHIHRPRALENEDCICLAYFEAPARLTGPIGRWLEKFRDIFVSQDDILPSPH